LFNNQIIKSPATTILLRLAKSKHSDPQNHSY
jgi:hypothetical protein